VSNLVEENHKLLLSLYLVKVIIIKEIKGKKYTSPCYVGRTDGQGKLLSGPMGPTK
jgi:hypothetical protein